MFVLLLTIKWLSVRWWSDCVTEPEGGCLSSPTLHILSSYPQFWAEMPIKWSHVTNKAWFTALLLMCTSLKMWLHNKAAETSVGLQDIWWLLWFSWTSFWSEQRSFSDEENFKNVERLRYLLIFSNTKLGEQQPLVSSHCALSFKAHCLNTIVIMLK